MVKKTGRTPVDWAIECVRLGAGELLVTSIDREGSFEGFDIDLVKSVCEVVKVPVVANGGAGLLYDLIDVVQQTSVSGVACSSIFAFTDNKPVKAKAFMEDNGIKIRPLYAAWRCDAWAKHFWSDFAEMLNQNGIYPK